MTAFSIPKPATIAARLVVAALLSWLPLAVAASTPSELLVISYHDIRDDVRPQGDADPYAISTHNFAAHLDWLSGQGYKPVDLDQVVAAQRGEAPLPPKAVLLTFDDGLRSHYTHAFPLLQAYGYPAVMAVVTDWVDLEPGRTVDYGPRAFASDDFLTWAQLRQMQASGLVEVASHSHALHRGLLSNPQGNLTPAAITRIFDPATGRYETEAAYRARIHDDLSRSVQAIAGNTGVKPRSIVWPYAAYSDEANRIADGLGLAISFDLEGRQRPLVDLHGLARLLMIDNPGISDLALDLRREQERPALRAVQVDLDYVYDPDPAQLERNLDALIDRIRGLGPTHVFLQAFADPDGNGSADALYFPNRHLPVRADLFNRVAWQLRTRAEAKVFAWLPVLGYKLADPALAAQARIPDEPGSSGEVYRSGSRPTRACRPTSATSTKTWRWPAISTACCSTTTPTCATSDLGAPGTREPAERTQRSSTSATHSTQRAQRWRPKLVTVRNLYARPVLQPESEAWFAQRLDAFLEAYDYTALMAMPWMEGAADPDAWLRNWSRGGAPRQTGWTARCSNCRRWTGARARRSPGERMQPQIARHAGRRRPPPGLLPGRLHRATCPPSNPHALRFSARSFPYPPR